MSNIVKNVVFIGGAGQAGLPIFYSLLKACVQSGITISALSRTGSASIFPAHVPVLRTDYSPASLRDVLRGQDVVISVIGDSGLALQKTIIDAAIEANVKRIIPSEFGCRTYDPEVVALMPYFAPKRASIEYLMTKEDKISWTAVISGPFFDEALKNTFHGYEPPDQFYLLDGGDSTYCTTNLHTIGYALFKILSNESNFIDSANQYITIHSHVLTQNDILQALEAVTGTTFKKHHVSSEELYKSALRNFKARGPNEEKDLLAERDIIQCITYGKGQFQGMGDTRDRNDWTERLGLPHEDLFSDVKGVVDGQRPSRTY
ncbi:unnamed protein product [Clonostachys rhizophaga]|uniref:NmrA-like domain-containing protein n=1 Tax=Clonostachys rhizophaga TaxID=160324 RepID=A0A9N9V847_9HYPO|nr:unnamed protein product [Clonostachys rhizophaga]